MAFGFRLRAGQETCFARLAAPLNSVTRVPVLPSACPPDMARSPIHMMAARPPRRGPDAVRALRGAMQAALAARRSRLAVRFPDGAELGIERRGTKGQESASGDGAGVVRGDRELARCVVALFEGTGLSVCAVFPTRGESDAARKLWGAPAAVECAFDFWTTPSSEKGKKGTFAKGGGSQAGKGHEGRTRRPATGFGGPALTVGSPTTAVTQNPGDIISAGAHDVYIVVSPRQQAMARVMQLCQSLGDDHLVVVLNCRVEAMRGLPADVAAFFADTSSEFEDVYLWMPNPSSTFAGGVLFREFPGNYTLCRRTPLNTLQVLFESDTRPAENELTSALRAEAEKPSQTIFNKLADFLDKR